MTASARNFSLAQRWWDPDGPQKALHALNPARLGYVAERTSLRDAAVLDVGCGGGLLSEALAQTGAKVTAIDLAPNLLKVARLHGLESGIKVDYREMPVEQLAEEAPGSFDATSTAVTVQHGFRYGGIFVGYSRYEHRLRDLIGSPDTIATQFDRQSVRAGLTIWLPLYGAF